MMDYLTFHIREEATEAIKAWQAETGGADAPLVFTFAPALHGCRLQVERDTASAPGDGLELPLEHWVHREQDPLAPEEAMRWRTPQYHGSLPEDSYEIDVKEIVFWIDGDAMQRLQQAGWAADRLEAFDYRFHPGPGVPAIWARDRASGEEMALAGNLG
jgi:hypothetical protein